MSPSKEVPGSMEARTCRVILHYTRVCTPRPIIAR